ncbi:MAG: hypothetical protein HZA91_16185 [Verrucomicrobia bacterium]|nr:hypothetical protein [Verrucomicrobiota bacterium]
MSSINGESEAPSFRNRNSHSTAGNLSNVRTSAMTRNRVVGSAKEIFRTAPPAAGALVSARSQRGSNSLESLPPSLKLTGGFVPAHEAAVMWAASFVGVALAAAKQQLVITANSNPCTATALTDPVLFMVNLTNFSLPDAAGTALAATQRIVITLTPS